MDFPIIDLLDNDQCVAWLEQHFHPSGLCCPHCEAPRQDARLFRINAGSGLPVYRCRRCQGIYNLYSATVFAGSQLVPEHVVLIVRGVLQGQPSAHLAREIGLTEKTVLKWRQRLQARAEQLQPETPLPDPATESDEMFQNAGEKRRRTFRPGRPATPPGEQAARAGHLRQ
jgi:transposase-like protein